MPEPSRAFRAKLLVLALALLGFTFHATPARGGDVTAFLSTANPSEAWGGGWGGALSSSWFEVLAFEAELAWQSGDAAVDLDELKMTSFTASGLVAPPIGLITPYAGVGFGLFRQSLGSESDTGRVRAFILGAKLSVGVVVLKAEYRKLELSGEPLLDIDTRWSVGGGVSF
jgi:hypothetical protein